MCNPLKVATLVRWVSFTCFSGSTDMDLVPDSCTCTEVYDATLISPTATVSGVVTFSEASLIVESFNIFPSLTDYAVCFPTILTTQDLTLSSTKVMSIPNVAEFGVSPGVYVILTIPVSKRTPGSKRALSSVSGGSTSRTPRGLTTSESTSAAIFPRWFPTYVSPPIAAETKVSDLRTTEWRPTVVESRSTARRVTSGLYVLSAGSVSVTAVSLPAYSCFVSSTPFTAFPRMTKVPGSAKVPPTTRVPSFATSIA